MSEPKLKAAGYIRVSSPKQVEGESLTTQSKSIEKYCKQNGHKLTEIYPDEGISGGTVSERPGLLKCLNAAQQGKFDVLVIHRLSRFGRNARELLNNHEELSNAGIQLRSISEGIDFDSKYGKAMLGMMAVMAELEKDIIRDQLLENRIALAKKGFPATKPPFGRTFNYKTEKYELNDGVKKLLNWAADEYLDGTSLYDISEILQTRHDLELGYHNLIRVLTKRSGDSWTVQFEGEEPIEYDIPRILSEEKIQRVIDRLAHNTTNNRTDVEKYVLTGFIRCMHCKKSLSGQTQAGGKYQYYLHPGQKWIDCDAFSSISLPQIEKAVFHTIFENIADMPSFEKAIAESLPDEDYIKELENKIDRDKGALEKVKKGLANLKDTVKAGAFEMDDLKEDVHELKESKARLVNEINDTQNRLDDLPNIEEVRQEAKDIRRELLRKYQSPEHLEQMTYDEKKQLLHFLFDGKAPNGDPYGIYIDKKGSRKSAEIDYFMFGRLTGLRTLKGDDIDYFPEDDSDNSTHRKSDYKTKRFNRFYC